MRPVPLGEGWGEGLNGCGITRAACHITAILSRQAAFRNPIRGEGGRDATNRIPAR